ncbi:protein FAM13A isoform X2 [Genypterus blacodes]|uniref:protein FAM13A isoform X2 n=1 Tax=Genypterus blacodes TaxID=154954 RepID=UPI003F762285
MGAGALTICHNKAAVQVKEDMKKMVQMPILRPRSMAAKHRKLFGVSLFELQELGQVEEGVPLLVRRMVAHLRKHALRQEGLFRVNGNVRAVDSLKQQLEAGEEVDFSEADVCTVASLLKQYLRDLPEGLVDSTVQMALIHQYQECGDEGSWSDVRELLQQLPDVHFSLLRYMCRFLALVEQHHDDNRMTALNLATVFGPNVFHVAPGFEAMKDQNICNKIMAKLIQNYTNIFETNTHEERCCTEERSTIIIVQEAHVTDVDTKKSPRPSHLNATTPIPAPTKKVEHKSPKESVSLNISTQTPKAPSKQKKVRKENDSTPQVPQPGRSARQPRWRPLSFPIVVPLISVLRSPSPEAMETVSISQHRQEPSQAVMDLTQPRVSSSSSMEALSSSQEDKRPISPFYMSNHLSPVRCRPDVENFLERTIRSAVEQHLFSVNPSGDQSSEECEVTPCPTSTARQRRRHQREQHEEGLRIGERSRPSVRADTDKENVPSSESGSSVSATSAGEDTCRADTRGGHSGRTPKARKAKHSPTPVQLTGKRDAHALNDCVDMSGTPQRAGENNMETLNKRKGSSTIDGHHRPPQTLRMKIQESPVTCDKGRVGGSSDSDCDKANCEDVPRLDLTALTEDNNWGEPVPAYSLQRESMDREEARLSPHAGGRLIRQLVEEDSDPMVSPRFYAYGHCQQYLDDTEVPPSPPNTHSFASRRRSSSLGSCDDEREELTPAQLTKRIHILKKKIHKFEERFEEERKYRPSHSDKAANPEVLRWASELSKLRKELKENKLLKSEEDLPPLTRQRSNTLPKSFGSQLEKKPQQEKAPKPPVESTLEVIQKKLQEKREEVTRPEDIKDMTREQIGSEKVALQKALLYYESIHGRPVTKSERQIMKPLYDRYRLVKQILCRASTIPVIEEEDGSEDDGDSKTQFTVTVRTDLSVLGFLDHMDEDGFISPVDELSPSKNTTDMRLSNLHSATTQELVGQLQETREEKKRIRKNLKEFEDQFFRQNGRNVQKEDRSPLAVEYNEYKQVKAKLRLLEVLISKRDSTS